MSTVGTDQIDNDFFEAIDRLRRRSPRHPDLVDKVKRNKALHVNPVNIALEAGHSRSTYYERAKATPFLAERRSGLQAKLKDLEKLNKQLVEERDRSLDTAAAVILRMRALEQSHQRAARRAERASARPNANQVVGNVVNFPGKTGQDT